MSLIMRESEAPMHSAFGPTTVSAFWPMADVSQTADGVVTHSEDARIAYLPDCESVRTRRC